MRKQKPDLYHFEDIVPIDSRVYPNDKFKFLDDPVTWAGHDQYYEAAIKERNAQLEQFHPSDWSLDHDHRITWAGMIKMADENSGCLDKWEIFEKPENKGKINIGFKRPKIDEIKTKLTEQQKRDIKVAILKGEHEVSFNWRGEHKIKQCACVPTNKTSGLLESFSISRKHMNKTEDLNVLFVSLRGIVKDSINSQNVLFVNFHAHENLSHKKIVLFYDVPYI